MFESSSAAVLAGFRAARCGRRSALARSHLASPGSEQSVAGMSNSCGLAAGATLRQRILAVGRAPQLIALATLGEDGAPRVRYVTGHLNERMELRFGTSLRTPKIAHLRRDNRVSITLRGHSPQATAWLEIEGQAGISTTAEERRSFWLEGLRGFFSGPDDPDYCVVIVRPARIALMSTDGTPGGVWVPSGNSAE